MRGIRWPPGSETSKTFFFLIIFLRFFHFFEARNYVREDLFDQNHGCRTARHLSLPGTSSLSLSLPPSLPSSLQPHTNPSSTAIFYLKKTLTLNYTSFCRIPSIYFFPPSLPLFSTVVIALVSTLIWPLKKVLSRFKGFFSSMYDRKHEDNWFSLCLKGRSCAG